MPGKFPNQPVAKTKWQMAREDIEQQVDERTPLKPAEAAKPQDMDEKISLVWEPIRWCQSLSRSYSWRLLAMVACTNHMLKGFVAGGGDEGLVGKPIEFIFGDLGLSASRLQMLKAAAIAPWALKPVVALLSDALPICGYKRMPYVVITTIGSLLAALTLGFQLTTSVPAIVFCLFLIFLQVSSVDLLVEAKQSEEVKQKAKLGPQFFTFTWLGINFGQVASVIVLGPLITYAGPHTAYLLAAPFIALVLWPTLANFLGEKQLPIEERGVNLRIVKKHPILCSMTLLIGCLILTLITSTFLLDKHHLFIMVLCFGSVVVGAFLFFIRWEIAGPIIFYFLLQCLSFNIDGALFYFFTDSPLEFSSGPHFSTTFYTTGLGVALFTGITLGFITGEAWFKSWNYRDILKLSICLRATSQFMMVPILLRWTVLIGVPDEIWVMSVLFMDSLFFAWRWIPKQVMGAHLTPQGMEATMLGLSAGTFNMAMILSSYLGGFLLQVYGVSPVGSPGDGARLSDLWKVQILAAFAPCAMLFLLPACVPAKAQTEPLLEERRDSATYGSAFELFSAARRRGRGEQ